MITAVLVVQHGVIAGIIGLCYFIFVVECRLTTLVLLASTCIMVTAYNRADSKFVPHQWETALLCNDVSHWLGANLVSSLYKHLISVIRVKFVLIHCRYGVSLELRISWLQCIILSTDFWGDLITELPLPHVINSAWSHMVSCLLIIASNYFGKVFLTMMWFLS